MQARLSAVEREEPQRESRRLEEHRGQLYERTRLRLFHLSADSRPMHHRIFAALYVGGFTLPCSASSRYYRPDLLTPGR